MLLEFEKKLYLEPEGTDENENDWSPFFAISVFLAYSVLHTARSRMRKHTEDCKKKKIDSSHSGSF